VMATRVEEAARLPGAGERVLRGGQKQIWPFLGPAFIACVAYIDPGNFATNISGGSQFGFTLVWVIVASNLMAMLIQTLSAKLGIATGRNLPEVCRERFSRRTSIALWLQAEVIAMAIAGLINMAMLVMAASVFYKSGLVHVESLETAYKTLKPILGGSSSTLFALALLASGLSSSTVGTLSGQVVMQGFVRRRIPVVVRRVVTMLPALVVVGIGVDPSRTLVISQVVLSFGIPFALVPLVLFTSKREIMGVLVNHRATTAAAAVVAGLISALNVFLLAQTFGLA